MHELATVGNEITERGNIAALFEDFLSFVDRSDRTARAYTVNFRAFVAWMNAQSITHPTRADIVTYRNWLSAPHAAIDAAGNVRHDAHGAPIILTCKPATVKAYLQAVKMFFKWTASAGLYPNIADNIHAPKIVKAHKKDALTPADVVAIESSIKETADAKAATAATMAKDTAGRIDRATVQGKRLYAMYVLAVNAGLRTVEISRANVGDYEKKGNQAYLYIWGKGHTEADQKKAIAPDVAAALDEYIASRDDATAAAPLFVATGNRSGGRRIAPTTISTMLKKAMKEAGYNSPRLTAHSLRHTTAAAVMNVTGKNIYKAQKYMRHESPETTEIYLENDETEQEAETAVNVYDYYHGIETADDTAEIMEMIKALPAEQRAAAKQFINSLLK